jgi:hypothetical protein
MMKSIGAAMRRRLRFFACAGVLAANAFPAQAATPADLLASRYVTYTADINTDGCPDILVKAPDVVVMLDLDDLLLPVPVPGPMRPFMIRSAFAPTPRSCNYQLFQDLSREETSDPRWAASPAALIYGDVLGSGIGSLLVGPVTVTSEHQAMLFNVTRTASGFQLLQSLGGMSFQFEGDGVQFRLGYADNDSRTDLIVNRDGIDTGVFSADASGLLYYSGVDNDVARLTLLWKGFLGSLSSGSVDAVLARIVEHRRPYFLAIYEEGGLSLETPSTLESMVTQFNVLEVQQTWARACFLATVNGQSRLFFVTFVQDHDGVWRLFSM